MYQTIKVLLSKGYSHRKISRELGIHRKTVREIAARISEGAGPGRYERELSLSVYDAEIRSWRKDLSAVLIHQRLEKKGLSVSYSTVCRYLRRLDQADAESFVPQHCEAGEEAQVDFGDAGRFLLADGSRCRVWVFVMVLSHSRYAYCEVVRDQRVETFLRCHRNAFEYFGGVPGRVKLDNLKAGVLAPSFYEPVLQHQYAEFLAHYGCVGVPCQVRKPEHKGKVESGVKYVKGNFFRDLSKEERVWEGLDQRLASWLVRANGRKHGTTRRIVREAFAEEQPSLLPLPERRYEFMRWEERKVNRFGHVTFDRSYYSVPHPLVGQQVVVQSNGSLLRVIANQGLSNQEEVALHSLAEEPGTYCTRNEHLPPHKLAQSIDEYREKMAAIGPKTLAFLELLFLHHRAHWRDKARGILALQRHHDPERIEEACSQALQYQLHTYQAVRDICRRLARPPDHPTSQHQIATSDQGFHHELSLYDQL